MRADPTYAREAHLPQTPTKTQPLASVLMLAYNHEPYIAQSIASILDQNTTFPFELLIGEDCSTDRTKEIALDFARSNPDRVKVLTAEGNVGMLANVRRLEEAFCGRYAAFCEGDDYWHDPDKLETQVRFLESHPDYVMVHSDYRRHFVKTELKIPWTQGSAPGLDDADAYNELLRGSRRVMTVTACVRGDVLREVVRDAPECYDTRFLMGDTQRWFEMAHRGRVKYLPLPLATRRVLPESATQSRDPAKVLRFRLNAKAVIDHYACKYPVCPNAAANARGRHALSILNYAYAARDASVVNAMIEEARRFGMPIPVAAKIKRLALQRTKLRPILSPTLAFLKFSERFSKYMRGPRAQRKMRPA